jgi:hypothetical protein
MQQLYLTFANTNYNEKKEKILTNPYAAPKAILSTIGEDEMMVILSDTRSFHERILWVVSDVRRWNTGTEPLRPDAG